jgi:hypothetical protein
MVVIGTNPILPTVVGKEDLYELNVLLGCQKILDLRGAQTLEGRNNQKK